jgi:hypothetical protein
MLESSEIKTYPVENLKVEIAKTLDPDFYQDKIDEAFTNFKLSSMSAKELKIFKYFHSLYSGTEFNLNIYEEELFNYLDIYNSKDFDKVVNFLNLFPNQTPAFLARNIFVNHPDESVKADALEKVFEGIKDSDSICMLIHEISLLVERYFLDHSLDKFIQWESLQKVCAIRKLEIAKEELRTELEAGKKQKS